MDRKSYIKVDSITVIKNRIEYRLRLSRDVKKYFRTNKLFIEYLSQQDMTDVDGSILAIPLISLIITLAWVAGADIYLDSIDETCLHSMDSLKAQFREFYPQFSYASNIYAKSIVHNKFENKRTGLFLSGGLDSVTSCVKNREKSPELISVWGTDIPYYQKRYWEKAKAHISEFAHDEGLNVHFVRTNMKMALDERLLDRKYSEHWWSHVSHSLIILGLSAPLTGKGIGSLLFASTEGTDKVRGVERLFAEGFRWADIKAVYDSEDMTRLDKIRFVKKYPRSLRNLRVCFLNYLPYFEPKYYNCSHCEKCVRTIVGLLLEGVNPSDCCFQIDPSFFKYVRDCLIKGKLVIGDYAMVVWSRMQERIPERPEIDIIGSQDFFVWFKTFDMNNYKVKIGAYYLWLLRYIPSHYKLWTVNLSQVLKTIKERIKNRQWLDTGL